MRQVSREGGVDMSAKKPGLRTLKCTECGFTRDVEMGIKSMFHCAREMVDEETLEAEGEAVRTVNLGNRGE